MGWLTIPGTSLLTFIFFGFLVAGEEIESTFLRLSFLCFRTPH
jgi:hypothetical protein